MAIEPTLRSTITPPSMLLASLVAQQPAGGGSPRRMRGYVAYKDALRSQGWSIGGQSNNGPMTRKSSKTWTCHEAVIDFHLSTWGLAGPGILVGGGRIETR